LGEIADNNKWSYYKFTPVTINGNQAFTTILTALSGDPDLFISTMDLPTLTSYQYKSARFGSDLIQINNNNPDAPKLYYIGVYCFASPCKFSILVSTQPLMSSNKGNNKEINVINKPEPAILPMKSLKTVPLAQPKLTNYPVLKEGVSEKGTVTLGAEMIYEFVIGKTHCDMKFELTALSGDPDLYLAYQPKVPSTTAYDYSANSFGSDVINIPKSSSKVETILYVGIYGFSRTDYSILATTTNCS